MGANRHPGGDSPGPSPAKPRRAADLLARLRRATFTREVWRTPRLEPLTRS